MSAMFRAAVLAGLGWGAVLLSGAAWSQAAPAQAPAVKQWAAPNDGVTNGVRAMERGHYAIAMRAWRVEADKGHPMAQANIGYLYEHGHGVGQSYVEAMAWYRKAASQNLPQAQFNIGTLYFYGYGVEQNQREAVGWFRQAARQDLADAQYMLGLALHEGQGTSPDSRAALEWFTKAALQGHVGGQLMAAMVYLGGDHGKPEPYKAHVWADVANANGNKDAALVRDYASFKMDRNDIAKAREQAKACLATAYRNCMQR